MKIDRNSYGTLAVVFFIAAVLIWTGFRFIHIRWISWVIAAICWLFCVWQMYFFRIPDRTSAGGGKDISSAADGKVVIVDEAMENEFIGAMCKRVCIYMDFFDVHANFWPADGKVVYYKYHPGKHLLAFKPKASEENEHASACIETPDGQKVLFRQHAGTFARRIVNYAVPGMEVKAGDQCGIIKFGSRMDIYLPLDSEILVRPGDKVRSRESIIARLR